MLLCAFITSAGASFIKGSYSKCAYNQIKAKVMSKNAVSIDFIQFSVIFRKSIKLQFINFLTKSMNAVEIIFFFYLNSLKWSYNGIYNKVKGYISINQTPGANVPSLSCILGVEGSMFEILPQTAEVPSLQACRSTKDLWQPCLCIYSLRLEWYPCLLKYCRSRDTTGKGTPYKCGIKSCSKGYQFTYYVPQKQLCLWDEET